MLGSLVYLSTSKLTLYQGISAILKMKYNIRL